MSIPAWAALIQSLFYLFMVPVNLAFLVEGGEGFRVGTGVSAFVRWRARRRALRKRVSGEGGSGAGTALRVLSRLRFEWVSVAGRVSMGDAAATALACGVIQGAACGLRGKTAALHVAVEPEFSNDFRIELRGMLTARAGKIMLAAIIAEKGRIPIWKSIPLKT